jgi:proteasome component ECM29
MASPNEVEAKELALVGKVEMRIALTDSEKKLEDLLKVYLAPLLLKLGSDYVAVRNKVNTAPVFPLDHLPSAWLDLCCKHC